MNPYEQGYDAARKGQADWTNPYRSGTPEFANWLAGYKRWHRNITTAR